MIISSNINANKCTRPHGNQWWEAVLTGNEFGQFEYSCILHRKQIQNKTQIKNQKQQQTNKQNEKKNQNKKKNTKNTFNKKPTMWQVWL